MTRMVGRGSRRRAALCAIALSSPLAGLALAPSPAHAQSPSQGEVDRAVALGREGRELYESGRFAEALERFRAADRIARSPVLVLYIARCERNLAHLVASREAYRRAAEATLAPDAPPPFVAAQADAKRELADLEARLPRVQIVTKSGETWRITLDGALVEPSALAAPIAIDPGDHVLVATGGAPPATLERRFRAVEAGPLVTIDLVAAPPAETAAPPAPTRPPPDDGPRRGTLVPGFIGLGFGVAGLGVGVATGLVASSKTSDIESRCDGTSCLASDQPLADEASTFATVSTIGFIVGGVGVATGIVLLVALSGDEEDGAPTSASPPAMQIGLGPAGIRGGVRF